MNTLPIWIYWDNLPGKTMPEYIKLCIETIKKNCGSYFEVKLVNSSNVRSYLPSIHRNYNKLKLIGEPETSAKNISIRTAYIRAKLLYEYGGIWMDADTILLKDLSFLLAHFAADEFVACSKLRTTKGISNGFLGSLAKGTIITKYVEAQEKLIDDRVEFKWGELGLRLLTPIVTANEDYTSLIEEDLLHPIIWENWAVFFERVPIGSVMHSYLVSPIAVTLFNSLFARHPYYHILETDRDKILTGGFLISKLLRYALNIGETHE